MHKKSLSNKKNGSGTSLWRAVLLERRWPFRYVVKFERIKRLFSFFLESHIQNTVTTEIPRDDAILSIGITTFKRRSRLLKKLLLKIRKFSKAEIFLMINNNYKVKFNNKYRKNLLRSLSKIENCLPFFFPSFTSLSKMWNTLIINSSTEYILILNDDIILKNKDFEKIIIGEIRKGHELFTINNTWSNFVISKTIANELNYFDERLLAYGEEDSDMLWRYIEKFHKHPHTIRISGITNMLEGGHHTKTQNLRYVQLGSQYKPLFNRNFIFKKYEEGGEISGMYDKPFKRSNEIKDKQQYPYENFKKENIDKL